MDADLYEAVVQGELDAIRNLREKIDQVTEKDERTILHLASKYGKTECVRLILTEFKDKNFLIKVDKIKRRTALHYAAKGGYLEAVKLLVDAARLLPSSSDSDQFENYIRQLDAYSDIALNLAARYNSHVDVVKLLVEANPSGVDSKNVNFETPLYNAAEHGHKETVELIFDLCTNPTVDGPGGKTVLHAAALGGNPDCVRVILDKRGDLVLKRDAEGLTAADHAASENNVEVLDILLKAEINQFQNDYSEYEKFITGRPHKETGLHKAAINGHIDAVLLLMKSSRVICSAVNEAGRNILHIAVDENHEELVQLIIKHCPVLSLLLKEKDEDGNTPLHLLVMKGCFIRELIELLEGVDHRNAKNNKNFTPYDSLYDEDDIVADQLKIKEALEDSQFINQRWNFGLRKGHRELENAGSSVLAITRARKDAKFKKARDLLIKEEIKLYRARINTQIIVTALITTVTFTVGFTMPGGYSSEEVDEGSAVLSKKAAFNVFVLTDTMALLLSLSSLALYFVASMYQDAEEISKLVDISTLLNTFSVVAMMLTFVMGVFLVLPHSSGLLGAVFVMSGLFLLLVVFLVFKVMKDPIEKFRE